MGETDDSRLYLSCMTYGFKNSMFPYVHIFKFDCEI